MRISTMVMLFFSVMLLAGTVAAEEAPEAEQKGPQVIYHAMEEPMIINLVSPKHPRYVQLGMTFLVDSEETVAAIDLHMPVIRNNVDEIIGQMSVKAMQEAGVRKLLRAQVLTEVNRILEERAGMKNAVQEIYFDSFVVQ